MAQGKLILFAVPALVTPACFRPPPPWICGARGGIQGPGRNTIACVAVNDAFVMDAWGRANHVDDRVLDARRR